MTLKKIHGSLQKFESEAHKIFGTIESAPSRIISLKDSYFKIEALSIKQDDLLRQALRCIEHELFRAAHVMSWAAMMDYLQGYAGEDNFTALLATRPKQTISSVSELGEKYTDSVIIQWMWEAKLTTRPQRDQLKGLLSRRNLCAHPSDYYPDLNITLGYVSELIHSMRSISKKRSEDSR